MPNKTLYDVLQVSRHADPETIKAAYKSLVQRYHPDRNPDNPDAEKILKEINHAYEVLSDPVKRAGYDAAENDEAQTAGHKDWSGYSSAPAGNNDSRQNQDAGRKDWSSYSSGAAPAGYGADSKWGDPIDRSATTAKKRGYLWMLDLMPGVALGKMCSKLVSTSFEGSPDATGWAVGFAMLFGGVIGIALFQYIRTRITKNMQNSRNVFFVSLSLALGFALAIITTTALIERSAKQSQRQLTNDEEIKNFLNAPPAAPKEISYEDAVKAQASPSTNLQQTMALAEQGNAIAQYNLAVAYRDSLGVPQDYAQAAQWFRKAADQGSAYAQTNLGSMYYDGQGVPQDRTNAALWYRKAAEQGLPLPQYALSAMYDNGIGVPQDYEQAMMWCRKAAEQGNVDAQYGLGYLYHAGHGVPRDYTQAMMWYITAKAGGSTLANQNLQQLERLSTPAQIAEAQRMAQVWWAVHHAAN